MCFFLWICPKYNRKKESSQVPLATSFPAALGLHTITRFTLHRDLSVFSTGRKESTPLCASRAPGAGAAGCTLHKGAWPRGAGEEPRVIFQLLHTQRSLFAVSPAKRGAFFKITQRHCRLPGPCIQVFLFVRLLLVTAVKGQ